ncbi:precorrin-8X methylmutase, partial [Rhizobiaceae bacterium]|nr:precorrin-8X methylmutase [Rhizobiaceae bacterium]
MSAQADYIRDPAEIYRRSFATVEREAALDDLSPAMRAIAIRVVHSCGMVDIVADLEASASAAEAGAAALRAGSPVFCDVEMVARGIIESRLPAANAIVCTLNDEGVEMAAARDATTRSAAAVDLWSPLDGSVVCIGNAPTALFRLLERIKAGEGAPALIVGIPVGFVGAVESKEAL